MDVGAIKERVIFLYFEGNEVDQITNELLNEGVEINNDLICNIMHRYISSIRNIRSFNDIDSQGINDKQKSFIKTIIDAEKSRQLYKQKILEAAALKKEHIKNMDEITKPFEFKQSVAELDTIHSGMMNACLMDLLVNGTTIESLDEFIGYLEEIAIEKHIKVKIAFRGIVKHSERDLEAMRTRLYESRAKKWLKDRKDSGIEFR